MQVNTSTGDGTCEYKYTGAITRNSWKLCKYSSTVEGIFRANIQVVVKEQGFMRVSPQVDVREQGFVRVSPQVKVRIGTNPPVNAGMWTKESNFKFDFYLFPLPLLKDRVKGSKVSDTLETI